MENDRIRPRNSCINRMGGFGTIHGSGFSEVDSEILQGITLRIVQGYSDRTCVTLIAQKFVKKYTYLCTRAQSTLHEQRALRRSSSDDDQFL